MESVDAAGMGSRLGSHWIRALSDVNLLSGVLTKQQQFSCNEKPTGVAVVAEHALESAPCDQEVMGKNPHPQALEFFSVNQT